MTLDRLLEQSAMPLLHQSERLPRTLKTTATDRVSLSCHHNNTTANDSQVNCNVIFDIPNVTKCDPNILIFILCSNLKTNLVPKQQTSTIHVLILHAIMSVHAHFAYIMDSSPITLNLCKTSCWQTVQ